MKPTEVVVSRYWVDLTAQTVRHERAACEDLEDALGGIARAFKMLESRPVADAYDPAATLILNLGVLSGTSFMTGLRTFFHAWSPLKCAPDGRPSPLWTAGSCKFGTKLRQLGVEEVVFTGRSPKPALLRIVKHEGGAKLLFEDAADLAGLRVNAKIQALHARHPDAHFAVLGPAGENFAAVRYAAIALSTENQLKSGDAKMRFCGRGGVGGVMGSKNLLAIVADCKDPPPEPQPPALKDINMEVARGKGSARFREAKSGGGGGTWANYTALNPVHAMPEMNFVPTGSDVSVPLYRENVEHTHVVKDEACYRCGIRCHKNVYDKGEDGKAARFRAKLDFEPLNLLSSNLGIYDIEHALELVELVDELGMDSISCGVTLSYAMEFNRRHANDGKAIAGGVTYGDFEGARRLVEEIAAGRLELLGRGTKRLADHLGEPGYAMHCKGMEFPAYLPQTNPGYPFALAGGHMSMRTYLLLLYEKETGLDYWIDAITRRGPTIMRDDVLGGCKFTGLKDEQIAPAVSAISGIEVTAADIARVVMRTYLRGWRMERRNGFRREDYAMPAEIHREYPQIELPQFNTADFFATLRDKVVEKFDAMAEAEGLAV
jgi:aldehyde:ferredoxin oxidoreductase